MIDASEIRTLLDYPQAAFGEVASPRWKGLCESLGTYTEDKESLSIRGERKWELLSALQKSIRRGNGSLAVQLIATASAMPTVVSQLPRRLAVIACEDIGSGDETLTRFAVACSAVFTPKRHAAELQSVLCLLTSQMCSVPGRSRIACSLSLIAESFASGVTVPDPNPADRIIFAALQGRARDLVSPDTPWRTWQRRNDWRGERMLRYLDLPLPFELLTREPALPDIRDLYELPSYSYDMHTRVGRAVIQSLIRGAQGAEGLKRFFATHKVLDRSTASGMALFYNEGGLSRNEVAIVEVLNLEQRMMAQRFGLKPSEWHDLRTYVNDALEAGVVDRLRGDELERRASQLQLQFGSDDIGTEESSS